MQFELRPRSGNEVASNQHQCSTLGAVAVFEGYFYERQHIRIVLLTAFKLDQVVIGAPRRCRKLTASAGSRMIDGALARLLIQKHASLAEQLIGAAAKYSFLAPRFRKARGRGLGSNSKVGRQSFHVSRCDLHAIINRAAIGDAFIAIVVFWFLASYRC